MSLSATQIISENVRLLSQIVREICENKYLAAVSEIPLTKNQFSVLRILYNSGPMSISELADLLNVSRAAASKNVEYLVKEGMLNRKMIKRDRRYVMITLKAKGEETIKRYDEIRLFKQSNILAGFTADEQYQFARLLEKYIQSCLDYSDSTTDIICLQCNGQLGEDCGISKQRGACYFHIKDKNLQ